jgi:hypothetical protein
MTVLLLLLLLLPTFTSSPSNQLEILISLAHSGIAPPASTQQQILNLLRQQ